MPSSPSKFNSAALCTKKTEQVTHLDAPSLSQQTCSATTCSPLKAAPAFHGALCYVRPFSGECQECDCDVSSKMTGGAESAKPESLRYMRKITTAAMGNCAGLIDVPLRSVRAVASSTDTHNCAPGSRRTAFTHLIVKSSTRITGKSGESRSNTGQSLVSLLCLAIISFKFTCPAAYLSLKQPERMNRLRLKPLQPVSLGT